MIESPKPNLQDQPPRLQWMDPEGKRWTLDRVRPFFIPHFIQAVRIEDGTEVVVHLSDFQRRSPG